MAEKKTQPLNPGGAWLQWLWENVVYVLADKGRKHQADLCLMFLLLKGKKIKINQMAVILNDTLRPT